MRIAITRAVSPALADCELTHLERSPIDLARAERQHAAYEEALAALGCRLRRLPAAPDHPDSVFVEDCAVVLDEVAVIARPGAASRRGEVDDVAAALAPHRPLLRIEAPHTLDGGDVLHLGRRLYVGLSARSTPGAIGRLGELLAVHDVEVEGIAISGCLHLKSAVSVVGEGLLLVNPDWVDPARFPGYRHVAVAPGEPFAANALLIGDAVIMPEAHEATRRRLEAAGVSVFPVDVSELAKAEGGVTCCSLLVED